MTAIISESNIVAGGTSRIGGITLSAADKAINALPSLQARWRADAGLSYVDGRITWRDLKNDRRLIPGATDAAATSVATYAANRIGSKPAITLGLLARYLTDPDGIGLIPLTGDWTVVGVARGHTTDSANWNIYGTYGSSGNFNSLMRLTTSKFRLYQGSVAMATGTTTYTADSPFYFTDSFDDTANIRNLRINGVQELNTATGANVVGNSQLTVGASQTAPGSSPGGANSCVAELMIFNLALSAAANVAIRTQVESYITAYYSDAVWA